MSSNYLTKKRFVDAIDEAIECFIQAQQYKFAIAICNFIIPYFFKNNEYTKLSQKHKKIHELYETLRSSIEKPMYYYVVQFIGKPFKESGMLDKKYIYLSELNLGKFKEYIQTMHQNKNAVVMSKLEVEKNNITNDDERAIISYTNINCFIERIVKEFVSCNTFVIETMEGFDKSRIKVRYFMNTAGYFPSVSERNEVKSEHKDDLSPVQTANADVDIQLQTLKTEIKKLELNSDMRIDSMQKMLMGVLSANVNGGCVVFLDQYYSSEEIIERYDDEELIQLFTTISDLLDTSKKGMTIHKLRMKSESAGLQTMLEDGYLKLEKKVKIARTNLEKAGLLQPKDQ